MGIINIYQTHFVQHVVVLIPVFVFIRYAKHYLDGKVKKRTLLKVFGIRIDIIVQSLVNKNYFISFLMPSKYIQSIFSQ